MFTFSSIIGIYSLSVFALGVLHLLNEPYLLFILTLFVLVSFLYCNSKIKKKGFKDFFLFLKDKKNLFLCLLLFFAACINVIGALGPEIGFDALWYHLVIPKIYLSNHGIDFIKGNLLYYAELPKLGEMLYIPILAYGNEIWVKFTHFLFGIFICIVLYRFSREFLKKNESLLVVIIFYSNLVVGWLSIAAYTDLISSFFEICAAFYFYNYTKNNAQKNLIFTSVLIGLAISTKIVSIMSLPIFIILLLLLSKRKPFKSRIREMSLFSVPLALILSPWLLFSYIHTGNPFYPLFENIIPNSHSISYFFPLNVLKNFINAFLFAPDPLSPIYLIAVPLIIINFKSLLKKHSFLFLYFLLSLIFWYVTPYSSSRFLVAYLPLYSLLIGIVIFKYLSYFLKSFLIVLIIGLMLITMGYRMLANAKYIPYITLRETKQNFLVKHLNFEFGDFYDIDQEIKKIVSTDRVLIIDTHNLFYVDFFYDHITWKQPEYPYKYLLTQGGEIPAGFGELKIVYQNLKTHAKLYKILK